MSKIKKESAVYFKSLTLKNVRCFSESQTLDLNHPDGKSAQWTLILGNNGVGKTTLLQCLAWMIPVPKVSSSSRGHISTEKNDGNKIVGIIPSLSDAENTDFESLLRAAQKSDSSVTAEITAQFSQGILLQKIKTTPSISEVFTKTIFTGDSDRKLTSETPSGSATSEVGTSTVVASPLVVVYGANRRQGISYLDKN